MVNFYKTIENAFIELPEIQENIWINLSSPTELELRTIGQFCNVPQDYLRAALDEEERSRIEFEDNCTLILVDVPLKEANGESSIFTTLPLGIVIASDSIITICTKEIPLIHDFIFGHVKGFYTYKKTRFILQLLHKNATYYLQYLRQIDRMSTDIERGLHKSMKNRELFQLLDLEKSLVYFSTSLRGNSVILDRMLKLESIKKYPEDEDLLEDVIIENRQAIEMANIYTTILSGMRDAFASVISNNLNIAMKFLTSVTIVLTIPTMTASFFGMNVPVPMSGIPHAFWLILGISFGMSTLVALFMAKKKMF